MTTRWIAPVSLGLFGIALWRRALLGDVLFWHDVSLAYMPLRKAAQEAAQAGLLPLWEPKMGCGFPVLAEGQAGVFYPPSLLAYAGLPYYHAYSASVVIHCLLAAVGVALLCRSLRIGRAPSVAAGLIYGYSGFFVTHALHVTMLESAAWLPLLLLCVYRGLLGGQLRWWAGAAVCLALAILPGHPQIVFYQACAVVLLAAGFLLGGRVVEMGFGGRLRRALAGVGLVFVLGAGLAAVQLAPTADLARQGGRRAEVSASYLRELAMSPRDLAYLVHPYIAGSYARNNFFGGSHYYEVCAYSGALSLPVALVGLLFWRRRMRWYALTLVLVGFGMALAHSNPLYDIAPHVPGLNLFRAPGRWVLLSTLGIALLAGGGLQSALASAGEDAEHQRRRAAALLAGFLAAGLLGLLLASPALEQLQGPVKRAFQAQLAAADLAPEEAAERASIKLAFVRERLSVRDPFWLTLVTGCAACTAAAICLARGRTAREALGAVIVLALAGELYAFGYGYNGYCDPSYYTLPPVAATVARADAVGGRVYTDSRLFDQPVGGPGYAGYASGDLEPYMLERERLRPNRASLYDVACADAQYGLVPRRHYELIEGVTQDGLAGRGVGQERAIRILQMLGTRYLITSGERLPAGTRRAVRLPDGSAIADLGRPTRCRIVEGAVRPCASGEEALAAILSEGFDPLRDAVVEGYSGPSLGGAVGAARVVADEATRVRIEATLASPGLLLLADSYDRNWRAWVDGRPAELLVANYILRGVPLPEGLHTVEFRYLSRPLRAGAVVSGVCLAILALMLWSSRSAPRRGL